MIEPEANATRTRGDRCAGTATSWRASPRPQLRPERVRIASSAAPSRTRAHDLVHQPARRIAHVNAHAAQIQARMNRRGKDTIPYIRPVRQQEKRGARKKTRGTPCALGHENDVRDECSRCFTPKASEPATASRELTGAGATHVRRAAMAYPDRLLARVSANRASNNPHQGKAPWVQASHTRGAPCFPGGSQACIPGRIARRLFGGERRARRESVYAKAPLPSMGNERPIEEKCPHHLWPQKVARARVGTRPTFSFAGTALLRSARNLLPVSRLVVRIPHRLDPVNKK